MLFFVPVSRPLRQVTLHFELSPAGIFGVEDPPSLVIPTDKEATDGEALDPKLVFSSATQSYPEVNRDALHFEWKGLSVERKGHVMELRASGMNVGIMVIELEQLLRHILENLTLRIGQPVRYRLKAAVDDRGQPIPLPPVRSRSLSFYDNNLMDAEIRKSVEALEWRDETFDQAIGYYQAGCRFQDLWTDYANRRVEFGDSERGFEAVIWSCGFLQYWKAITAILEEPVRKGRRKKIFQGRVKALRLTDETKALLYELKNIRDDFDVSHRAHEPFSRVAPRRNYWLAQHVASQVLLAYQQRIAAGKPSFGPHPVEVHELRKGKRSPLEPITEVPNRRIAHYTLAIKNPNWETGAREVSSYGDTTITLRFPVGKQEGPDPDEIR